MNRKLFGTTVLLTSMIGLSVFCGEPAPRHTLPLPLLLHSLILHELLLHKSFLLPEPWVQSTHMA